MNSFTTKITTFMNNDEIETVSKTQMDSILYKMHTFEEREKGWSVSDIILVKINFNKWTLLEKELQKVIQKKSINVKTMMYIILSGR